LILEKRGDMGKEVDQPEEIAVGVAGIILDGERILIARRSEHDHLAGRWEFPGGGIERGEFFDEALRREIREELGIEISVECLVGAVSHLYGEEFGRRKLVSMLFFRCRFRCGEAKALGCAEFRWVFSHELAAFDFADADRPILEKLTRSNRPQ
jgi:mutator protein MutT